MFFKHFSSHIGPGSRVVDLGSGDGSIATRLADAGAHVTAVDRKEPKQKPEGVTWITSTVEAWIEAQPEEFRSDAFLLKNVLQFLEKGWALSVLLPKLAAHLVPGGTIGIETFTKAPEPPFAKSHASFYSLDELKRAFPGWEMSLTEEASDVDGFDLAGNRRIFHLTRLIATKPT